MCFGCSEEPSHRDGAFKYPQHIFQLRNTNLFSVTHSQLKSCNVVVVVVVVVVVPNDRLQNKVVDRVGRGSKHSLITYKHICLW